MAEWLKGICIISWWPMPASHALPTLPQELHIAGSSIGLEAPPPAPVSLPVLGSQPHVSWSFVADHLNTTGKVKNVISALHSDLHLQENMT